jgi:hypothetical protein
MHVPVCKDTWSRQARFGVFQIIDAHILQAFVYSQLDEIVSAFRWIV